MIQQPCHPNMQYSLLENQKLYLQQLPINEAVQALAQSKMIQNQQQYVARAAKVPAAQTVVAEGSGAVSGNQMVYTAVELVNNRLSAQKRRRSAIRQHNENEQNAKKAALSGHHVGWDSGSAQDRTMPAHRCYGLAYAYQMHMPATKKHDSYMERANMQQIKNLDNKRAAAQGSNGAYDLTKFKKRKPSQHPKMAMFQQYIARPAQHEGSEKQHLRKNAHPLSKSQSQVQRRQQKQEMMNRMNFTGTDTSNININPQPHQVFSASNIMAASQAVLDQNFVSFNHQAFNQMAKKKAAASALYSRNYVARGGSSHSIVAGGSSINSQLLGSQKNQGYDKRSLYSIRAKRNNINVVQTQAHPSIAPVEAGQKLIVKNETPNVELASQMVLLQGESAQSRLPEQPSVELSRQQPLDKHFRDAASGHALVQGSKTFKIAESGHLLQQGHNHEIHRGDNAGTMDLANGQDVAQDLGRLVIRRNISMKQQSVIRKKNNQYYADKQGPRAKAKEQYLATSPQILQTDLVFLGESSLQDTRKHSNHNLLEPSGAARGNGPAVPKSKSKPKQVFSHQESASHLARQKVDVPEQILSFGQNLRSEASQSDWLDLSKEEQRHQDVHERPNRLSIQQRRTRPVKNAAPFYQTTAQPSPENKTITKMVIKGSLNNEGNFSIHNGLALTKQHSQTPRRDHESNIVLPNISRDSNLSKGNSLEDLSHQRFTVNVNEANVGLQPEIQDEGQAFGRADALAMRSEQEKIWKVDGYSNQMVWAESKESLSVGSPVKMLNSQMAATSTQTIPVEDKSDNLRLQDQGKSAYSSVSPEDEPRRHDEVDPGERARRQRSKSKGSRYMADNANSELLMSSDAKNPYLPRDEAPEQAPPFAYEDPDGSPVMAQHYQGALPSKMISAAVAGLSRPQDAAKVHAASESLGSQHNLVHPPSDAQHLPQYGAWPQVTIRVHKENSIGCPQQRDAMTPGHRIAHGQKYLMKCDDGVKAFKRLVDQQSYGQIGLMQLQDGHNGWPSASHNSRKRGPKETRSQTAVLRTQPNHHYSGRHMHTGNSPRGRTTDNEHLEGDGQRSPQGHAYGGQDRERGAGGGVQGPAASHNHQHHHYHIDLNIQQVNNILINYGIMPMSYERPPASGGPSGQPVSGRGHSAYNMSKSQGVAKPNQRPKEGTMNRNNGKSQPRYQKHQPGPHAQSQNLAMPNMIVSSQAAKIVRSPPPRISERQFPSYKKGKKDGGQQSVIKLQNKMKSRHDKLQSQVQNLTQSKNQLMNHRFFHHQDVLSQCSGASDGSLTVNKASLEGAVDPGPNNNRQRNGQYINQVDASMGKVPQTHKGGRLVQAFDQFDASLHAAPPDLQVPYPLTAGQPQLQGPPPMVAAKKTVNFASADHDGFAHELRQANSVAQEEELYSDEDGVAFLRRPEGDSFTNLDRVVGDGGMDRPESRKILVQSEQKENDFMYVADNQTAGRSREQQYPTANEREGHAPGLQERFAAPQQQAEQLRPPYQLLAPRSPSRNGAAAVVFGHTTTDAPPPLLQLVSDASMTDLLPREALRARKTSKSKIRKEQRLSNGSAGNQSKNAKNLSHQKATGDKSKAQASQDAGVVVTQEKMKSLTVGKRQVQLHQSALKKRRGSSKVRGERPKRGGNLGKHLRDACSPANAANQRTTHSELKILSDTVLKTQDVVNDPNLAALPQSIDFSAKRGAASHTTANPKQLRQHLHSRDRALANVLKNQEYKIRQIDKQSKRTNILIEQFNEGSNGQRVATHASDQPYHAAAQSASKARPANDQIVGAISSKEMKPLSSILGPKPQISDFDIQEQIGIGNFGRVCKAYNTKLRRTSALKIIKKESIMAMKQVEHVIGEREVLKFLTLQHSAHERAGATSSSKAQAMNFASSSESLASRVCPFIINIFSSFQDEEHLYLELEYVEGCTLLSQINKRNHEVTSNMPFYAAEALLTLEFLHRQNIIYRDLKPENIVLSMRERGHMKLVDFGFARQLKYYGQKCMTNCGTPQYIAPELIRGAGHSHEVDIWSLGVLIADVVSGQTPFQAENTKLTYEKIILCQPTYTRQITQTQRDLLNKIFVSDPSMRINLQDIKKHAVFKDFDWERPVLDLFLYGVAPFVPDSALFNEIALRTSSDNQGLKGGNRPNNHHSLAGIFKGGSPAKGTNPLHRQLSFDNEHFQKFLKQDKRERLFDGRTKVLVGQLGEEHQSPKRKRQNPLGDFKFKRIDEYF